MYRKFYGVLEEWEDKKTKEPLLVAGARQVGKTWIIKKFCSERYNDHLSKVNLDFRIYLRKVWNLMKY